MMKILSFNNKEEIKAFFRQKVKELHPDKGGCIEKYLILQNWYKQALEQFRNENKIKISKLSDRYVGFGNSFYKTQKFTIKELALGLEKELTLPLKENPCPYCEGSGINKHSLKKTCSYCHGEGILKLVSGNEEVIHNCTFCAGVGYIYNERCSHCFGKGKIKEEIPLKIKLPFGLRQGDILCISGETMGVCWNFYIEVEVEPHPFWRLEGDNLICEVKVPFYEILLRDTLEVETLEGIERVPTGYFADGEPVVFTGRGPFLSDESRLRRGDLIVNLKTLFPKTLSLEAETLLYNFKNLIERERLC
ncbi:MAG: hypothetical protein N2Z40_05260 [Caldimicrobium sp.]|nr:hypothetical protein [Caldimicrobium sp.]